MPIIQFLLVNVIKVTVLSFRTSHVIPDAVRNLSDKAAFVEKILRCAQDDRLFL